MLELRVSIEVVSPPDGENHDVDVVYARTSVSEPLVSPATEVELDDSALLDLVEATLARVVAERADRILVQFARGTGP